MLIDWGDKHFGAAANVMLWISSVCLAMALTMLPVGMVTACCSDGDTSDELEWCQKTLDEDCDGCCNCDPPWYMTEKWSLEMQYETFGSISIEACNELVEETAEMYGSFVEEWDECTDTLSNAIGELQECQWELEKP